MQNLNGLLLARRHIPHWRWLGSKRRGRMSIADVPQRVSIEHEIGRQLMLPAVAQVAGTVSG